MKQENKDGYDIEKVEKLLQMPKLETSAKMPASQNSEDVGHTQRTKFLQSLHQTELDVDQKPIPLTMPTIKVEEHSDPHSYDSRSERHKKHKKEKKPKKEKKEKRDKDRGDRSDRERSSSKHRSHSKHSVDLSGNEHLSQIRTPNNR